MSSLTYVVQAVASDSELRIVDDLKGNIGRMLRFLDKRSFVWAASHALDLSMTEASCTALGVYAFAARRKLIMLSSPAHACAHAQSDASYVAAMSSYDERLKFNTNRLYPP